VSAPLGLLALEMGNVSARGSQKGSQTSNIRVTKTQPGCCFSTLKLATSRRGVTHIADIEPGDKLLPSPKAALDAGAPVSPGFSRYSSPNSKEAALRAEPANLPSLSIVWRQKPVKHHG